MSDIITAIKENFPNFYRNYKKRIWFLVVFLPIAYFALTSEQYKHLRYYDENKFKVRCHQLPPLIADDENFYYRFVAVLHNKYSTDITITNINLNFQTSLDIKNYKILLSDVPTEEYVVNIIDESLLKLTLNSDGLGGGKLFGLSIDCTKPKGDIDVAVRGATIKFSYLLFGKNHHKSLYINPMSTIRFRFPKKESIVFDLVKILDHRKQPDFFFTYHYFKGEDESGERRLEIYCPDHKNKYLRLQYESPFAKKILDSSRTIHNDIDPLRIVVLRNDDLHVFSWLDKFRRKKLAAHFRTGLKKAHKKEYSAAAQEFDAITTVDSKDHEAWFNSGLALELSGDLDGAIERLSTAISLKGDYWKAHYELANVYLKKDNIEKGIEHLNKAIELNNRYALAYARLGCLQKTLGNIDEAYTNLKNAVKYEANPKRANVSLVSG